MKQAFKPKIMFIANQQLRKVNCVICTIILLILSQNAISQKWIIVGNENFTPKFITFPSIALDKNSVPYVAYCDSNFLGTTVRKYNGTNWVTLGVRGFSGERPSYSSIAIDDNGMPYVLYLDGNRYATVQKYNGSNWEIVGGSSMSYGIALDPHLAIDKNNTPYVAYKGEVPGTYITKTTVKKFNGNNWELVGAQGFTESYVCSLVLDLNDTPYILCSRYDNNTVTDTTRLSLFRYNNSNWELVTTFSDKRVSDISMVIDKNGIMYVAYSNGYGYNVVKYNGSGWTKILNKLDANDLSISIDKNNLPCILYMSYGTGVILQKYEDDIWKTIGEPLFVNIGAPTFPKLKLAISKQNIPYAACYQPNNQVTVKKYDIDKVKTDTLQLPNVGCSVKCDVQSNTDWIVTVDKSWLSVNPTTGSGDGSFILTAEENLTKSMRTALVKITSTDGTVTTITNVFQDSIIKKVNVNTPGSLHASFNQIDKATVTGLNIIGTIDARDFKFIRDSLSRLTVLDLSGTTVAAYEGTEGTYTSINTVYNASTIPPRAFYNYDTGKSKTTLATVILPSNLISIGGIAFYGCNGLISINIPPTVTKINKYAFYGCTNLTSIDLPLNLTTIGDYAFDGCSKINSIKLPDGIISIGSYSFENCSGLKGNLSIPSSVTSIGDYAFNNCSGFNGSLTLSPLLSSIGQGVFYNCAGLSGNLSIPASVSAIGKFAFYNCKGLSGNLSLPNTVTAIGEFAFWNCHGFSGELKLPATLSTIEKSVFDECGNITSVIISPNVTSVGNYAFMACDSLKTISIPSTVKTIGDQSFSGCKRLTAVYVFSATPIDLSPSSGVFYGSNINNCILYVPVGSKATYQNAVQWKDFNNIVEITATDSPTINNTSFSLYPNPIVDAICVKGINGSGLLKLFDINGRQLLSKQVSNNESVPVSSLSQGVYIVKITTAEGTTERKIIKK